MIKNGSRPVYDYPLIMGIDPAASKKNAYCIFQNDRVIDYGMIRDMEHYQEILMHYQPHQVAIENQYLDKNPKSYEKLIASRAVLEYIASSLGFSTRLVDPKSWQSAIHIPAHMKSSAPERSRWIINLARSLVPKCGYDVRMNIDEACAVHIAAWSARRVN